MNHSVGTSSVETQAEVSICAESSAAEQVFGGRHVAVAFSFFHNSFVNGDNGLMVCLYERQAVRYIHTYIFFCINLP